MNAWNIPNWLEQEVIQRDKKCVYCGVQFTASSVSKKSSATWEHIVNDARIITKENICLCCCSCNASKGAKILTDWLTSKYCDSKGINEQTVADIIKQALKSPPQ